MVKLKNWSREVVWTPKEDLYPSSLEQLKQIVIDAEQKGLKIRAIGSLHSYGLCVTSDIQVHTDKLDKVLSIDPAKLKVRVEGGIKLKNLLKALAKEGLTLPNQGYILEQSIAGAIATATHGTGRTGTLSSFIEEIELVDATGNVQILNPQTNAHLFSAAVVNLGCLGIVYALTLRCIPIHKLKLTKVKMDWKSCLKELPQLLKTYDHFMFALCPYSERVITLRFQKTQEPVRNRVGYLFHKGLLKIGNVIAMSSPWIPRWYFPKLFVNYSKLSANFSCVDENYRILSPADEGLYVEEEIAIPMEHFEKAVNETKNIILQHAKNNPLIVAAIYIRFVGPDPTGYLSPTLNRPVFYMTFDTFIKKGYHELFHTYEKAMLKYQGRPHWGKVQTLTKDEVKKLYPETYDRFVAAKNELDPNHLFSNDYIHRLFE